MQYSATNSGPLNYGFRRPCGAMDNASDYGSEDSRFESWQGRPFFFISLNSSDSEVCISKSMYLTPRIPPNYELLLKRSLPNVIEEIHFTTETSTAF